MQNEFMSRETTINQLIARYRGAEDAKRYQLYSIDSQKAFAESAKEIMQNIPPTFGACAMLSAAWAAYLQDIYDIPAIVVAGDLKIGNSRIFKCKTNLPGFEEKSKAVINKKWDGHCWIEADGYIGDLSIFRTAYSIDGRSILKSFILKEFGSGRGAMLSPYQQLEEIGMKYVPKYVLTERQINGLIRGLEYMVNDSKRSPEPVKRIPG